MRRVLCVAGEISGDALLAPVVAALRSAGLEVIGVGGPESISAGLVPVARSEDFNVGGFAEVITHVPASISLLRRLVRLSSSADAMVLVDWPEVNMRLLRYGRVPKERVAYVAPPQAWAWRSGRAARLRGVGFVGCLFRFSAEWYRGRGVQAEFIGHPATRIPLGVSPGGDSIALLPGSRAPYARRLLPLQLAACRLVREHRPIEIHLGLAPTVNQAWAQAAIQASGCRVQLHRGSAEALGQSRVAMVGFGTATLETALAGRPFVGMSRPHPLTAWVGRSLVTAEHLALPNLILGRRAFPELPPAECTAENAKARVLELLQGADGFIPVFEELRMRLSKTGGSAQIAKFVLSALG